MYGLFASFKGCRQPLLFIRAWSEVQLLQLSRFFLIGFRVLLYMCLTFIEFDKLNQRLTLSKC